MVCERSWSRKFRTEISKWTVLRAQGFGHQGGRSYGMKVDGLKELKWAVLKLKSGRSLSRWPNGSWISYSSYFLLSNSQGTHFCHCDKIWHFLTWSDKSSYCIFILMLKLHSLYSMIVSNGWLSRYWNGLPKSPITIEQMNINLRISSPFTGFVIKRWR